MRICIDTVILLDVLKDEYRAFQEIFYQAIEKRVKTLLLQPSSMRN
jgi:hypothetical protein